MSSPQPPIMRWSTLVTPRGVRNSSSALVVFGLPFLVQLPCCRLSPSRPAILQEGRFWTGGLSSPQHTWKLFSEQSHLN